MFLLVSVLGLLIGLDFQQWTCYWLNDWLTSNWLTDRSIDRLIDYHFRQATKIVAARVSVMKRQSQQQQLILDSIIRQATHTSNITIKTSSLHHFWHSNFVLSSGLVPPITTPRCRAFIRIAAPWSIWPPRRHAKDAHKIVPSDRFSDFFLPICNETSLRLISDD